MVPLVILLTVSCFGIDRRGGILQYSNGRVTTGLGHFRVGSLPAPWKGPKIRLKQLVFENAEIDGTIVTDALCGPKFDEAPLSRLAGDLFDRLEEKRIEKEESFLMAGRRALRMRGLGSLDGVLIRMEAVVLKKDFCLFDFVYFAPPSRFAEGINDFRSYLNGFRIQ